MSRIRHARPSPSLVIAILALMVAIGGTAYAASKVGGKDLKSLKVRSNELTLQPGAEGGVRANCKRGERYVSGGWDATPANAPLPALNITTAGPTVGAARNPRGFELIAANTGAQQAFVSVNALCLKK